MTKTLATVFGVLLLLVGILGFIPGVTNNNMLFGVFHVNTVHNIIHLLSGAIALWAGMSADTMYAKRYFQIFGVIYALVAILGFIYGGDDILGFIASNTADTWLHVVIALIALYFGFAGTPTPEVAAPEPAAQ